MRILFSGSPAYGHILPMLPLVRAASNAGHDVAILTSADLAEALTPIPVLTAGPSFAELLVENVRRNPSGMGAGDGSKVGPSEAAAFFAGTRVDVTFTEALAVGTAFAPDLIVAETADYVGPLIADAMGVPWARHGFGVELPRAFVDEMDSVALAEHERRGVTSTSRRAYLDPCADFLQREGWRPARDRITVRPEPFATPSATWQPPDFAGGASKNTVLVTFGTIVDDDVLLTEVMHSLEALGVRAWVTSRPGSKTVLPAAMRSWAVSVGFVPLAELLEVTDAVVTVGGAGTVLSSLSAAKPMVILPVLPDHHWNAERAAATGSAIVIGSPAEVGAAVDALLSQPTYREDAASTADRISEMNSPQTALSLLLTGLSA